MAEANDESVIRIAATITLLVTFKDIECVSQCVATTTAIGGIDEGAMCATQFVHPRVSVMACRCKPAFTMMVAGGLCSCCQCRTGSNDSDAGQKPAARG